MTHILCEPMALAAMTLHKTRGHRNPESQSPNSRFKTSYRFPKLHGHFVSPVAHGARSHHFAQMTRDAAGVVDLELTGLADGERLAQEKRHAAERQIAGEDLVRVAGVGAVDHGDHRPVVHRLSVISTTIAI